MKEAKARMINETWEIVITFVFAYLFGILQWEGHWKPLIKKIRKQKQGAREK